MVKQTDDIVGFDEIAPDEDASSGIDVPHNGANGAALRATSSITFPPPAQMEARLKAVQAARNPFLQAAGVLLRVLADIGDDQQAQDVEGLRTLIEQEIASYTRLCDQANLRRDHMLAVRYALCTAIDEAAGLTTWGGGEEGEVGAWSAKPLLQTFHQEGYGGKTVFLLIGKLAADAEEHMDVLEVMLHILGLGFQGHYRTEADGHRMIETIRRRLHTTVVAARGPVPRELAARWRGVDTGRFKLLRSLPVWFSATVLGLTLLGTFIWYKYQLDIQTQAVEADIQAIINGDSNDDAALPTDEPPVPVADVVVDAVQADAAQVPVADETAVPPLAVDTPVAPATPPVEQTPPAVPAIDTGT